MKVIRDSHNTLKGNHYEFQIEDATGKTVWAGSGFYFWKSREDAINVAIRELTGQLPLIEGEHMTDKSRAVLRKWSDKRFGTHAG